LTVREPSEPVICSLKTYLKVSPTLGTVPSIGVFGPGLTGTFAVAVSDVCTVPPVIVAEPVTDFAPVAGSVSLAVQVLDTFDAVSTSCPVVFTVLTVAVLVTDPPGPVVPEVLTSMGPELNTLAGPTATDPVSAWPLVGEGSMATGVGPKTVGAGYGGPVSEIAMLPKYP
jgi:hypothetical protein